MVCGKTLSGEHKTHICKTEGINYWSRDSTNTNFKRFVVVFLDTAIATQNKCDLSSEGLALSIIHYVYIQYAYLILRMLLL